MLEEKIIYFIFQKDVHKRGHTKTSWPARTLLYILSNTYTEHCLIFSLLLLLVLGRGCRQGRVCHQRGQVASMSVALHEPVELVHCLRVVLRPLAQVKLEQVQRLHIVHNLSISNLQDRPIKNG